MSWRKSLVLLSLAFLLATTTVPAQAAEPRGSFDALWQLITKLIPTFGQPPTAAPQKTGAGIDPDGGDRGAGIDPSGVSQPTDPAGNDSTPAIDPDGLTHTRGSGMDPNGNEVSPAIEPNGLEEPERSPAMEPNGAS